MLIAACRGVAFKRRPVQVHQYDEAKASFPRMQANKCERKRDHPVTPCHPSEGGEFKKEIKRDANCVCNGESAFPTPVKTK